MNEYNDYFEEASAVYDRAIANNKDALLKLNISIGLLVFCAGILATAVSQTAC